MAEAGSLARVPTSPAYIFALDRDRNAWTGPSGALGVQVKSADGATLSLEGVNEAPEIGNASLFNGYWGSELTLPFDGCVAVFAPKNGGARVADRFTCGPVTKVPLQAGEFAIVGRGFSAEWMQWQAGNPWTVSHAFPLASLDFVTGGSHVLIHNKTPTPLAEDARNPRTMIGTDEAKFMYLAVVDGRSAESLGMTLPELQAFGARLGLADALNLDGGGSATMVLRHAVMNRPSDGKERAVASMVEIVPARPGCVHAFIRC